MTGRNEANPAEGALGLPGKATGGRWRGLGLLALQLACIVGIALELWRRRAELEGAASLGPWQVAALLAVSGGVHLHRTAEMSFMLRRLGVVEPAREALVRTAATGLLNHLPLSAGSVTRAVLLRRDHQLPYAAFASLTAVGAAVNLTVASAVGLFAMARANVPDARLQQISLVLGGALLACAALLWVPRELWVPKRGFLARHLGAVSDGISALRGPGGGGLAVLALLSLVRLTLLGSRLALCFGALGVSVSLPQGAILAATTTLSTLVLVTPGNIGPRELLIAVVSLVLGTKHSLGLAAASLESLTNLTYYALVGAPSLRVLKARRTAESPPATGASPP